VVVCVCVACGVCIVYKMCWWKKNSKGERRHDDEGFANTEKAMAQMRNSIPTRCTCELPCLLCVLCGCVGCVGGGVVEKGGRALS